MLPQMSFLKGKEEEQKPKRQGLNDCFPCGSLHPGLSSLSAQLFLVYLLCKEKSLTLWKTMENWWRCLLQLQK